ncbi:MAG: hypothetical protein KZQ59_03575 [Candidatus Thiodiazotropha sp. (ex Lucinoma aequizonata)]|nr:hypothetical protein [Candidatus Thiodiazotropha sp. (ex Lucinoma aequizonata)]
MLNSHLIGFLALAKERVRLLPFGWHPGTQLLGAYLNNYVLVSLLLNRITLNSKNSRKPPSTDPNRKKISKKGKSDRKPGGQKGHNGTTLEPVDDPDEVTKLKIDRRTLPKGPQYKEVGHKIRQIIHIDISCFVTEYWTQILEDNQGNRFVASFPEGVNRPV